jgi:hypothetical protein
MSENLLEYTGPGAGQIKIDKSRGILYGVKVLGTRSRNGRRYPVGTLKKAIPLYENAKVNIDHPVEQPDKPRSYLDRIGVLCNVQLRGEDGLYADFHFNPRHPLVEQLLWDAEHAPSNVGFSHNVEAAVRQENGETIVEEIFTVRSVDLVADPATTAGLFESIVPGGTVDCVSAPLEDFEMLRIENDTLNRKVRFLELMLAQVSAGVSESECRFISFFKAPFHEAIYRCTNEEEVHRLIADRLGLVRQIKENQNEPMVSVVESVKDSASDHRSFLEAITG